MTAADGRTGGDHNPRHLRAIYMEGERGYLDTGDRPTALDRKAESALQRDERRGSYAAHVDPHAPTAVHPVISDPMRTGTFPACEPGSLHGLRHAVAPMPTWVLTLAVGIITALACAVVIGLGAAIGWGIGQAAWVLGQWSAS